MNGQNNERLRKRLWLFVWFAVIAALIILTTVKRVLVPWWVILLIALLTLLLTLLLIWLKAKEGRYFDWWSVVHFLSGLLLGLLCVPFLWTLLLLVLWEIVEILGDVREYTTNSVMDVTIALGAWYVAKVIFGGSLLLF